MNWMNQFDKIRNLAMKEETLEIRFLRYAAKLF